jgi:uncharacterized protein YqhQ
LADEKAGSFHYGGQAVIEGVMMRGKKHFAVACRRPDGAIEVTSEPIEKGILASIKWLNHPFLRGTFMLIDSLVLGMKSLMWAANIAMAEDQAKTDQSAAAAEPSAEVTPTKNNKVTDMALGVTMFLSLGLAVVFFMLLPAWLSKSVLHGEHMPRLWRGLLEGGFKLAFLFLYIWGISHMKDIRRVFQYHGGEHKVINSFEAGDELTVENVQKHTTVHVRCGTSFLLIVVFVSILVFMVLPWNSILERVVLKLVLLPVVAGLAYEILKLAGNRKDSVILHFLLGPGLLMQRITTQEPSDDQVEVAIRSFQSVRDAETVAEAVEA